MHNFCQFVSYFTITSIYIIAIYVSRQFNSTNRIVCMTIVHMIIWPYALRKDWNFAIYQVGNSMNWNSFYGQIKPVFVSIFSYFNRLNAINAIVFVENFPSIHKKNGEIITISNEIKAFIQL